LCTNGRFWILKKILQKTVLKLEVVDQIQQVLSITSRSKTYSCYESCSKT